MADPLTNKDVKKRWTETYLRCRCCENEVSYCTHCEEELANGETILCSDDRHICKECDHD